MPDFRARSTQIVLLVLAVLTLVAVGVRMNREAQQAERLGLEAALRAVPMFVPAPRVTLFNRAETAVPLDSYHGRLVFVNFWATWCGPCVAEMASLIDLQKTLDPADIAFVSISEDDTWPPVDAYLQRSPLPFDVYRDRPPRVEDLFKTTSYPTSFLIDREGITLYRFDGARHWDTQQVRDLLALEGVGIIQR